MQQLREHLARAARLFPDKPALVSEGATVTYETVVRTVETMTDRLAAEGMRSGDRVLVLYRDPASLFLASHSVMEAGGVAVPHVPDGQTHSIEKSASACRPALVVSGKESPAEQWSHSPGVALHPVAFSFPLSRTVGAHSVPRASDNPDGAAVARPSGANGRDSGGVILGSDGDDGVSRGNLLTNDNLLHAIYGIGEFAAIGPDHRELVCMSPAHAPGFIRALSIFAAGGTALFPQRIINPATLAQSILKTDCNALSLSAALCSSLLRDGAALLRSACVGILSLNIEGDGLSIAQKKKLIDIFPNAVIVMHYGTAAAPDSALIDLRKDRRKLDTAGRPAPHAAIAIIDRCGNPLEAGVTGEVAVRGGHRSPGYWKNGTFVGQDLLPDNWLRTGDVGFIDKEGYLHVLGPSDGFITVAGIPVHLPEVEEKIRETYPGCEICVIGIPDPGGAGGEIPVLCYIPRDGKSIIVSELSRLLSRRFDSHKIPRIVYRMDEFPRSEHGILRNELKKRLLEGMGQTQHPVQ